MASLFGIPLDAISNLSDSSEHLAPTEKLKEKMVFVGGRYTGKTHTSRHEDFSDRFSYISIKQHVVGTH